MINEQFQTLVKESYIVLKTSEIKICPKCGRLFSKEDNFCTQCAGVPLLDVRIE